MDQPNPSVLPAPISGEQIESLRQILGSTNAKVLTPSDDGYAQSIERWSRAAEKEAGVVVIPSSPCEVSIAVAFANRAGIDLAVKGGGHSTAGTSSTHGGLLIDLCKMRKVRVEPDEQRIYVQGGAVWGDVDNEAWKHGLATVGGTVADTGVGGLTLGGGYGVLSGLHGLVIDNLVGATTVVSSGEIIQSSETENSDLFWALKGAGQNFGVTIEFVLKAFPQSEVFMGSMIFAPSVENMHMLCDAANKLFKLEDMGCGIPQTNCHGRVNGLLGYARPPGIGKTMLLFVAVVLGSEEFGREILADFFKIEPLADTMAMGPYPKVNTLLPARPGFRSSVKGAAFSLPMRAQFMAKVLESYESFHHSGSDFGASVVAWELYDPSVVLSQNNGCFANRGLHMNSVIMPMWSQPENDLVCRSWASTLALLFEAELKICSKIESSGDIRLDGSQGVYGNYDQQRDRSKENFGKNYAKLQVLKAKYDEGNTFNKLFNVTSASL